MGRTASHEGAGGRADRRNDGGLARRSARSGRDLRRDERVGGSNSVVESQPSKLLVAGSIPVSRSILRSRKEHASFGWQATEGTRATDGIRRSAIPGEADLSAVAASEASA